MNNRTELVINIVLMILFVLCIGTFVANLFICCGTTILIVNEIALAFIIYALYSTLKERITKV